VPPGVTGELYISGAGVGDGYYGQPEQTGFHFVSDPFRAGSRMYRSGDLGYRDLDGHLFFAGRRDGQVKLRGYRIELEEISRCLSAMAGVSAAVVQLVGTGPDRRLVAYVTGEEGPWHPDAGRLRSHVSSHLPFYMVPG